MGTSAMRNHPYTSHVRQIRDTPEDAVALRDLLHAALQAGEMPDMTLALVPSAIDHAVTTAQPALLAFDGSRAVGFFLSEFTMLWVAPHARRRGHAHALVTTAFAIAERVGGNRTVPAARQRGGGGVRPQPGFRLPLILLAAAPARRCRRPAPQWPEGYTQRTFRPGADDAAYVDCLTTAFASTTAAGADAELLARAQTRPSFAPANIGVVVPVSDSDPQTIVAFCRVVFTAENEPGGAHRTGVLPTQRGLGLGRELLRWGVARLQGAGAGDVLLNVEGGNTNALTLYLRHGFQHDAEWPHWTLAHDAATAAHVKN